MKTNTLSLVLAVLMSLTLVFAISCHPDPEPTPPPTPTPTPPDEPLPENCFKDYDGNVYEMIVIGEQTWMKQNLRVKHYADGTPLTDATDEVVADSVPMYIYPDKRPHNFDRYGLLYNWTTATRGKFSYRAPSGVQGICPDGWHIPSMREWQQMLNYVSSQSEFLCESGSENIAKALSADTLWQENKSYNKCSPMYDPKTNNLTGFSAVPSGTEELGIGTYAKFWSTGEKYTSNGETITIKGNDAKVSSDQSMKVRALAVRCVKD